MAEAESEGPDVGRAEDEGLQDHIDHWVDVLDRWVKGIDLGMGIRDNDAGGAGNNGSVPSVDDTGFEPAIGV